MYTFQASITEQAGLCSGLQLADRFSCDAARIMHTVGIKLVL